MNGLLNFGCFEGNLSSFLFTLRIDLTDLPRKKTVSLAKQRNVKSRKVGEKRKERGRKTEVPTEN